MSDSIPYYLEREALIVANIFKELKRELGLLNAEKHLRRVPFRRAGKVHQRASISLIQSKPFFT